MDGSVIDLVSRHDLQIIENAVLADDRNGKPNSAVHFDYGYAYAPAAVYFDPATGGFTLMAWAKFLTINDQIYTRIIDFATDVGNQDSLLIFIFEGNLKLFLTNNDVISAETLIHTPSENIWFHFAVSVSYELSELSIYVDGSNVYTGSLPGNFFSLWIGWIIDFSLKVSFCFNIANSYRAVTRTVCGVGKSFFENPNYNGYLDELKIYNKALTIEEVNHSMNL